MKDPLRSSDQLDALWQDLHGRVRHWVGRDQADDVVQEAFLRSLGRQTESNGSTIWLLLRAARSFAYRLRLREGNRRHREQVVAVEEHYWPATGEEGADGPRRAMRLLMDLPEPYREVLRLRYLEGLEILEIARRLGRPRGTVGSQVKRGLERLRERLGTQEKRERRAFGLAVPAPLLRWRARTRLVASIVAVIVAVTALVPLLRVRSTEAVEPRLAFQEGGPAHADGGVAAPAPPSESGGRTPIERIEAGAPTDTADGPATDARWLTAIRGTVRDPEGAPVSGAELRVGGQKGLEGSTVARTDAEGRFEIEELDGRQWLWAEAPGRVPSFRHSAMSVDSQRELILHMGEEHDARIGHVKTAEGSPASRAKVTFMGGLPGVTPTVGQQGSLEFSYFQREVFTSSDGSFPFALGPDGWCGMLIQPVDAPARYEAVCAMGSHDIFLPRGCTLVGRVLAEDGRALAGVPLRLCLLAPLPALETTTDGQGAFRFEQVTYGPYELVLADESPIPGTSLHDAGYLGEGNPPLIRDVYLRRESLLRGRVLRDGQPQKGWIVELDPGNETREARRVRTDEEGRFVFVSSDRNASHILHVLDPIEERLVHAERVDEGWGDERQVIVDDAAATCGLRGTITVASPADAPVFAELLNEELACRWTVPVDPRSGEYAFDGVLPGKVSPRVWLRASGPRLLPCKELLPGTTEPYDVFLREAGSLRVRIVLPPDVDPALVSVRTRATTMLSSVPAGVQHLWPDESGLEFRRCFQPGQREYRVLIDGDCFEARSVFIEPGLEREETVVISPFVRVTFLLTMPRPMRDDEHFDLFERWEELEHEKRTRFVREQLGPKDRLSLFVPLATTEIEFRSNRGLQGLWRGQLRGTEPLEFEVRLEESGAAEEERGSDPSKR